MRGPRHALPVVLVALAVVTPPAGSRPASGQAVPRAAEQFHLVRQGDTLSAIAKHYGVTVSALVVVNWLPGPRALLRVGHRLTIPPRGAGAPRASRPPAGPASRRPARPRAPATLVLALPDFGDLLPLFTWPVEGPVSSTFGRRRSGWHRGIDIKADPGVPVLAASGGVVVTSGVEPRYGRVVKIEHPNGFMTVYAHNDKNTVESGDRVFPGQPVGLIGRTGRATAHHLHFEVRHAGLVYNPLYLLPMPPRIVTDESLDEEPEETDE